MSACEGANLDRDTRRARQVCSAVHPLRRDDHGRWTMLLILIGPVFVCLPVTGAGYG